MPLTSRDIKLRALRDPDCKVDIWWRLAARHPYEAMTSPLFGVLTLETPERWIALLDDECVTDWIGDYHCREFLSLQGIVGFALDCAERVLPFTGPEANPLATEVIRVARKLALRADGILNGWGDGGEEGYTEAFAAFSAQCDALYQLHKKLKLRHHANAVISHLRWSHGLEGTPVASREIVSNLGEGDSWESDFKAEARWQWDRLVLYLNHTQPETEAR